MTAAPTLFDTDPATEAPATVTTTAALRIAGVDPSLTGTGIALSNGLCYKIGRDKLTALPPYERVDAIADLVDQIVRHLADVDLVVIEEPLLRSGQGGAYDRYLLWVDLIRALRAQRRPVAHANLQSRMRYATGSGAQRKGAIVDAVARRLPLFATGGDDNLADAAILCAMGADHLGSPLVTMPAAHRVALDTVRWPEAVSAR